MVMERAGKVLSLGTGGDGTFSVYEVYQNDNLPTEYRIVIQGGENYDYDEIAISEEENNRILKEGFARGRDERQ